MRPRFRLTRLLWAATIVMLQTGGPAAAQVIDMYGGGPFPAVRINGPFNPSAGQSFSAPAGFPVLNSFKLRLTQEIGTPVPVRFEVKAFDWTVVGHNFVAGAVGPALFSSEVVVTAPHPAQEEFTFNTGGIALLPEQDYIAMLTPLTDVWPSVRLAIQSDRDYEGGRLWHMIDDRFGGKRWTNVAPTDAVFRAEFSAAPTASPVPEPISLALFAPGLAVFGLLKRRRASS